MRGALLLFQYSLTFEFKHKTAEIILFSIYFSFIKLTDGVLLLCDVQGFDKYIKSAEVQNFTVHFCFIRGGLRCIDVKI